MTPAPPPSTQPPPGRFRRGLHVIVHRGCGHAWGVVHNCINLVLLALVLVVATLLLRDELPVPGFIRTRLESELAARGFDLTFRHAQVDATARILAEDVTIAPQRFGGAILSAGRVFVEFDRLKLLAGHIELISLQAEDVHLICPPSLSPSGSATTLVEIASLRLRQHAGVWRMPGLVAAIGPVNVVAHGLFNTRSPERTAPTTAAPHPLPGLDHMLDQFAQLAPRVVREFTRLDALREPRLQVSFEGAVHQPVVIDLALTAAGWRDERVGELHGVQAHTHITLGGDPTTAPVKLTARIEHAMRPHLLAADGVELNAEWLAFPTKENYLPWQVHVAATRVQHEKGTITAPVLAVFPLAFPLVDVVASTVVEGEPISVIAEGDVRTRSGTIGVHGSAGGAWLQRASTILGRDVTYYATITTPPDFAVHATFANDFQLDGVDFRVVCPPLIARHVALDRARVRGHLSRDALHVDHLEFSRGDESSVGAYDSDFHDRDYRFRLRGSVRPLSIASWFGPWWGRFWHGYDFRGAAPDFDIDAHGNWLRPEPVLVTGSGRAEDVVIRGVPCDAVRTHLFIRPNYFDLFDATIMRPEGRVDGSVKLRFLRGDSTPVWEDFAFSSNADLVALAHIFGPGGDALLAPYRYTVPPEVSLVGTVAREDDTYDVQLQLALNTGDEFRYLDFPLSWLTTRAIIHNRHVALPEIYAGYAHGVLTGSATVNDGQLDFDAKLANADFDLATKIYSEYVDRNFPTPPEKVEPGSIVREDYGGKLTLTLAANGPITDLKAFDGTGDVELSDAKLYQLRVIGIFSDLFGSGLGTFGFTNAKGAFEVMHDKIHFPSLRVTGRTARLDANGYYSLQDRSIDFRVRMEALRESSGFLTKILGVVINPLTNLLFEAHLTGTLRNPKRNVDFLAPHVTVQPEPPRAPPPVPPANAGTSAVSPDTAPVEPEAASAPSVTPDSPAAGAGSTTSKSSPAPQNPPASQPEPSTSPPAPP